MSISPFLFYDPPPGQVLGLAAGVWAVCTAPLPNSCSYIVPQFNLVCKISRAQERRKIADFSLFFFEKSTNVSWFFGHLLFIFSEIVFIVCAFVRFVSQDTQTK
jgi:hypothetical protein